MCRHDPYHFQVVATNEPFVVVLNGVVLKCFSFPLLPKPRVVEIENFPVDEDGNLHIVVYTPGLSSANIACSVALTMHAGGENKKLGSLTKETPMISVEMDATNIRSFELMFISERNEDDVQKLQPESILDIITDIFHDNTINPSFGALRLDELENELIKRTHQSATDIGELLKSQSDLCHCYLGKDAQIWAVLHSHCKKLAVANEKQIDYSELLNFLTDELRQGEECLSSLFRLICSKDSFSGLLASNFTILKKFLIKYNEHFLWFQDDFERTTKVLLHGITKKESGHEARAVLDTCCCEG